QLSNVSNYTPPSTFKTSQPDGRFNPFEAKKTRTPSEWEKLDELLQAPLPQVKQQEIFANHTPSPQNQVEIQEIFQVDEAFIIVKMEGELWVINQHRAHAHILYNNYATKNQIASQQLLFPRTIEMTKEDLSLYFEMQDEINALGFDTSEFGKDAIIINGLPSELSKTDGAEVVVQILDDFKTNFQDLKISKKEALCRATAKNAAIKAGKTLNLSEMQNIVSDLLHCEQYTHNANGSAIIVKLTKNSLERFFH
ncbi:hypothetical protein N9595_05015, partial [Bacteroidia bacterium]|nr:hypothetical protein [Bacteroidia bacterium]